MFLLLVLVHLQFPLGFLRLAALLGFPCWLLFSEWQTVREALLFLLCPSGCWRFIGEYLLGLGCQGCSGACSTPFSRLLQPSVSSVVDLGVMAFSHHPLPSPSLCDRVTLSVGVHSVCAPVSKSGGLAGLLRSQGSVSSSAGSSCFSSPSSLLVT